MSILVNTREFRRAGLYFMEHGTYTKAPEGTRDFEEFWDEEERRCKQGYSVGDLTITGRYYFYLNYCPILKIPEKYITMKNPPSKVIKEALMPSFWEIDYEWYKAKSIAYNRPFGEGNHLICAKTRGCGFSYKEASDGAYNYNFIEGSKSYYFASREEYLTKDGILNKVTDYLNHINKHTDWYKNRQVKDTIMHRKSSYLEGTEERGFQSQIMGVILNDPNKSRGKRGEKITFEEAGSFKNLKTGYQIAREGVEQGGFVAGQMSVFGTGGEEGEDIEGLEDMFNDPTTYNLLAFNNKWVEGGSLDVIGETSSLTIPEVLLEAPTNILASPKIYEETGATSVTGFFVPNFMANDKFINLEGVVDRVGSILHEVKERKKLFKSKDPKTVDRKTAERPFVPDEAFSRFHSNILPAHEAREQIKRVQNDPSVLGLIRHGYLVKGDKGVEFKLNPKAKPILSYPHKNSDDLTGCVTLYEMPYKKGGVVPDDLYQIVCDPYAKDGAEDRTSLGAIYVIKRVTVAGGMTGNIIVASYIGRPERLKMFYDNLFKLSKYYNAKVQSEIAGGGQAIVEEARRQRMLHVLEFEPDMLHNRELASNQRNKSYFMNMTKERKDMGLIYLADWLLEVRGIKEDGTEILNIHKIYDIGLLLEISKFRDGKNADRISALLIGMYTLKEKSAIDIDKKRGKGSFFSRSLFGNTVKRRIDGDVIWIE